MLISQRDILSSTKQCINLVLLDNPILLIIVYSNSSIPKMKAGHKIQLLFIYFVVVSR